SSVDNILPPATAKKKNRTSMRHRRKIAASVCLLALVVLGHLCPPDRADAGGLYSVSNMPVAAYAAPSNTPLLLSREAVCAVTRKARESFSEDAWSNDPEMYVRALSHDGQRSTPAKDSSLLDVSRESSANKDANHQEVTSGVANVASADTQQHTDQATHGLAVVVSVAAGAMVLILLGLLLLSGRHRRRGTIPYAALLNLPEHSPVAQTSAPASASPTEKRRAA
ncbi:MAG: hypothetical protein NTZ09_20200, partial [Candidatus Hydrogenedentes bacterium]|nr:hypothetical protein [Candidatus Hydrogenedentota bacterium]